MLQLHNLIVATHCQFVTPNELSIIWQQLAESVSIVVQPLPPSGGETGTDTTCATPVASTTRWTDKTGHSSNQRDDWWVHKSTIKLFSSYLKATWNDVTSIKVSLPSPDYLTSLLSFSVPNSEVISGQPLTLLQTIPFWQKHSKFE